MRHPLLPAFLTTLAALFCGAHASAEAPAVFEVVPDDVEIVIYFESLDGSYDEVWAFAQAVLPAEELAGINREDWELSALIPMLNGRGVDRDGEMALVVQTHLADNGEPPMWLVVPTTDRETYQQWLLSNFGESFTGVPAGDFMLVPVSPNVNLIVPGPGRSLADALPEKVGAQTAAALGESAVALYLDASGDGEELLQMLSVMAMDSIGDVSGDPYAAILLESADRFVTTIAEGAQGIVIALDTKDQGLVVTAGLMAEPDSSLASLLPDEPGGASELLTALPNQPYLYAVAVDTRAQGLIELLGPVVEELPDDPYFVASALRLDFASFDQTNGVAQAFYSPLPVHLVAGQLARTVTVFDVDDSQASADTLRRVIEQADGQTVPLGPLAEAMGMPLGDPVDLAVSAAYEPAAEQINGLAIDRFSRTITLPESVRALLGSGVNLARNFTELNGYVGQQPGQAGPRVVVTTVPDAMLMAASLSRAADGNGLGADDDVIAYRQTYLPEGLALEVYVDVQQALDSFGPFSALLGGPPLPVYQGLRPIAVGLGVDGDSATWRAYLPQETLRALMEVSRATSGEQVAPAGPAPF